MGILKDGIPEFTGKDAPAAIIDDDDAKRGFDLLCALAAGKII
jgi:hypothetical protein